MLYFYLFFCINLTINVAHPVFLMHIQSLLSGYAPAVNTKSNYNKRLLQTFYYNQSEYFWGALQGCQVFATKPAQLLLKTSPKLAQSRFEGGSLVKNRILGGKIIFFRQGSSGKIPIPGVKCYAIGVASARGHEKQPAATVLSPVHIKNDNYNDISVHTSKRYIVCLF